jgi:predicted O-methyltransferase YrrM
MDTQNTILIALLLANAALTIVVAFKIRKWIGRIHSSTSITNSILRKHIATQEASQEMLLKRIVDGTQESVNASTLAALEFKYPIFLGGWSIDSFFGRNLIQHILEHRPKCIVELGSGSSTLLMARLIQILGLSETRHIAVDHEQKYLELTKNVAALNGLEKGIEFFHCPLQIEATTGKIWYSGLLDILHDQKIDLLLIDGPPGFIQPLSRYPAIPTLYNNLDEHCTVILDDAARKDEQIIAKKWANEHSEFTLTFHDQGHGMAVLTR